MKRKVKTRDGFEGMTWPCNTGRVKMARCFSLLNPGVWGSHPHGTGYKPLHPINARSRTGTLYKTRLERTKHSLKTNKEWREEEGKRGRKRREAQAGETQWVGVLFHQSVVGSVSGQGTFLCCVFSDPGPGEYRRQLVNASVSHGCFSLSFPSSLSKKQWKKKSPLVRIKKKEER